MYPLPAIGAVVADEVKQPEPQRTDVHGGEVEDRRIAEIVDMKMNFRWRAGAAAAKAAEWGVSVGHVHNLSSRANKIVRESATDPAELAAELLPGLVQAFRAGVDVVTDPTGDAHAQAKMAASVASLGKVLVDIAGLDAPKVTKTEITGKDGGALQIQQSSVNLDDLTDEQLEHLARGEPLAAVLASGGGSQNPTA